MPSSLSPVLLILGLVLTAITGAMMAAWTWALIRLIQGRELVPEAPPYRVPWDVWAIAMVVLLQLVLSLVVGTIHQEVTGRSGMPPEAAGSDTPALTPSPPPVTPRPGHEPRTYQDLLVIQVIVYILMIIMVPALLYIVWGARLADLGLGRRGAIRNLVRGAVGFLLAAPVCYAVFILVQRIGHQPSHPHPLVQMLTRDFTGSTVALAVLTAVILAPLTEELIFRSVILGALERFNEGPKRVSWEDAQDDRGRARRTLPNVLTSILFAGLHYAQWPAPVPLFLLSLVLGWLRQRTGSLWAPIALHAGFNGLSTLVLVLSVSVGLNPEKPSPLGHGTSHACVYANTQSSGQKRDTYQSIFSITPLEFLGRKGKFGEVVMVW